jgi:hypothetical protein
MTLVGCGGGGGGGGGGGNQNEIPDPTGRLTIDVADGTLRGGDRSEVTITVADAEAGVAVQLSTGLGLSLRLSDGTETDDRGYAKTRLINGEARVIAEVTGLFAGTWRVQATLPDDDPPVSVFSNVIVTQAPIQEGTPTVTGGPALPTPTVLSANQVKTIYMEVDQFAISAATGGTVTVRAYAFDQNNQFLNDVNLLFDFSPKAGVLRPIATRTRKILQNGVVVQEGVAEIQIVIPPSTAPPGSISVTATAAGVQGEVSFLVVSGSSRKPVATVLLQTGTTTCGTDSGGSVNLTAVVFDADNEPVNDANVLFLAGDVGRVIPLTAVTTTVGNQAGVATTTLNIPAGTPIKIDGSGNILPYILTARAGGVEGTAGIFVVPGRECRSEGQGGELGEPASIILGSSPNRIRVRGAGVREQSTITATVIDEKGNRINDRAVRFSIAPESVAAGATLLPAQLDPSGHCSQNGATCQDNAGCPSGQTCVIDPRDRFVAVTDRAGNANIQLRSGTGLGTVTVVAEVPSDLDDEFTQPCSVAAPDQPDQRCVFARRPLVTVTAGLPGRVTLAMNDKFVDNNDGTFLTTLSAIITDARGNLVEDGTPAFFEVLPIDDDDEASGRVGVRGFASTNDAPPCDVSRFPAQTGEQVTPQPGTGITCITFPRTQQGTELRLRVESLGIDSIQTVTLPGTVSDLFISANPGTVHVTPDQDGVSVITAVVLDVNGNGVANAKVRLLADVGTFANSPFILTDADGIGSETLTIPRGSEEGTVDVDGFGGGVVRRPSNIDCDLFDNCAVVQITATGTDPQPSGQPQTVTFQNASPSTIGVRASALTQQSVLSFVVRDRLDTPLEAIPVSFVLNGFGGEHLTQVQAVTDENGVAQTSVISGTRAGPVQVTATVDTNGDSTPDLVAQSTAINVIGAPPAFNRFSLAANLLNISGRVTLGLEDQITAFLTDRFGNVVPVGTVVNFSTNGGIATGQTQTTADGTASTTLVSEGGVPDDGIVTVLAVTRGEEPFIDANGNGVYDAGEVFTDIPEPFIDANGNGQFDASEPTERFQDVDGNLQWDEAQSPGVWDGNAVIWTTIPVTMSGHTLALLQPETFEIENGGAQDFTLFISDSDLNPIVGGSRVTARVVGGTGTTVFNDSFSIPDAETFGSIAPGLNQFNIRVVDTDLGGPASATQVVLEVTITSDNGSLPGGGNGSVRLGSSGVLLPPPTGTPQPPATETPPPTPTFTGPPPTSTPTPEATATITPTSIPRALVFAASSPQTIGVRGSTQPEQSTISFRVTDGQANGVAGITVQFSLTSVGGETIEPLEAVSDSNGVVSTVLSSGTRATTVRVNAILANSTISAQSGTVSIVGALPAFSRFSMAPMLLNIAGRVTFGLEDEIAAYLNDRFGNAVPQGTVVNFFSNGGSVVAPVVSSVQGVATGTLLSEGGDIPPDGIVTIMGVTRGEETFVDANGNGVYDLGEAFTDIAEPFIDDNGNGVYDVGDQFELFVDTNNNGVWDNAQNPGVWDNQALIFRTIRVTFSAGTQALGLQPTSFTIPDGGSQTFTFVARDADNNPLVSGTTIAIDLQGDGATVIGPTAFTIPDTETFGATVPGVNAFSFTVADEKPGEGDANALIVVTVTVNSPQSFSAPGGNGSVSEISTGLLLAPVLPTPTP